MVALGGCAGEEKESPPQVAPTPIARLNTAALEIPRIEFCASIPDSAVSDALAGEPDSDTSYGNGEEQRLPGVGPAVLHEIGCSWARDDGSAARAWIFARPVTPAFARTVISSQKEARGCRTVAGPAYGDPSATQLCRLPGGEQRVRHAGLFDESWLTCELSSAKSALAELRKRTDSWCVEVATALDDGR